MSNYDSSFTIPSVNQVGTDAAAIVHAGKLWYFYSVQNGSSTIVERTTFALPGYVDAEAFTNHDAWASPIAVGLPPLRGYAEAIAAGEDPPTSDIYNASNLYALVVESRLYLFWTDSGGQIHATRSAGEDRWEPIITLTGAVTQFGAERCISGYAFGDALILIWLGTDGDHNHAAFCGRYVPEQIQPAEGQGREWPAETPITQLLEWHSTEATNNLSTRCTVLPSLDGSDSTLTAFISVTFGTGTLEAHLVIEPETGLPRSGANNASVLVGAPTTLDLDASNTIYAYAVDSSQMITRQALMNASGQPGLGEIERVQSEGQNVHAYGSPLICYVAASQRAGSLKTSDGPDATVLDTVETPLYRFMFSATSSSSGPVRTYVQSYGSRHLVATINDLYYNDALNPDAQQQLMIAKGIIDGPLPVPRENLRMMSQGGTVAPWDLYKPIGSVTYGTNSTEETTHQVTVTGSVGTSVDFSAAFGADWESDASVSAGVSILVEASVGVSTTGAKIVEMFGAQVDSAKQKTKSETIRKGRITVNEANVTGLTRVLPDGVVSEDAAPRLSDQGYVAGAALSIVNLAVAFEDPRSPGLLPARPSMITFMPSTKVQLSGGYTADYLFTPGDLSSYSREMINSQMATAYTTWRHQNPSAADPFGEDYLAYFDRVLSVCALPIGPGGRRYIEFSVTNEGMQEARFDLTYFNFEEWGTEVSSQTYTAGTWENLVNLVGWEFKSYLEAGKTVSCSSGYDDSTERSSRWGVSASLFNFPEATHTGDVCSYTFRLYLLPADNRWTQELLCFSDYGHRAENGTKRLDPNSRPWKIMFVVDPASIVTLT